MAPAGPPAPSITFLFTDIEGSTRLWEQAPSTMRAALERHDAILREAIEAANGDVVKTTGDGMMAVFGDAASAVNAAINAQRDLGAERWPDGALIRVRMGIHTGDADARAGDYFGPAVNRTARVMAAGHGGQILLSGATARLEIPVELGCEDDCHIRLRPTFEDFSVCLHGINFRLRSRGEPGFRRCRRRGIQEACRHDRADHQHRNNLEPIPLKRLASMHPYNS